LENPRQCQDSKEGSNGRYQPSIITKVLERNNDRNIKEAMAFCHARKTQGLHGFKPSNFSLNRKI